MKFWGCRANQDVGCGLGPWGAKYNPVVIEAAGWFFKASYIVPLKSTCKRHGLTARESGDWVCDGICCECLRAVKMESIEEDR